MALTPAPPTLPKWIGKIQKYSDHTAKELLMEALSIAWAALDEISGSYDKGYKEAEKAQRAIRRLGK